MVECVRIEHPSDGLGFWRSLDSFEIPKIRSSKFHLAIKNHHNEMQTPWEDPRLDGASCEEFCAMKNVEDVYCWFEKKWMEEIITTLGFRVYKLKIKEARFGHHQILFNKENIVEKIDISCEFI